MNVHILRSALFLFVALLVSPSASRATDREGFPSLSSAESSNVLISINDSGILPQTLEMNKADGLVFFFNDSADSLVTLSLDFGKHASHCATENLRIREDGVISSVLPIAPKDFAGTCFHDPGTYPFTVYGLKKAPQGLKGSIVVR